MPHTHAQLEEQLAQLQQQYMQRMAHEFPLLQQKLQQLALSTAPWRELTSELVLKFHTLAGSAGTFGLAQVGVESKKLELSFTQLLEQQNPPDSDFLQQAMTDFSAMRRAADLSSGIRVPAATTERSEQIGRASCRERVAAPV